MHVSWIFFMPSLSRSYQVKWFLMQLFVFWYSYKKALWWFQKTLAQIPCPLGEMWEPTVVNLAHVYRKLKYVIYLFIVPSISFVSTFWELEDIEHHDVWLICLLPNYINRWCLRMYNEAISYYEKALALSTRSVSTYAGLAYAYHLQVYKLIKLSIILSFRKKKNSFICSRLGKLMSDFVAVQ